MEKERVIELAQAIVNQKVAKYDKSELGLLLSDLQSTLAKFCDSFCDWLLMEDNRFSICVTPGPDDSIDIRVVLYFPLPEDTSISVEFEATSDE